MPPAFRPVYWWRPVIPALTDHEIEAILEAAPRPAPAGPGYVLLRLPYEIKDLFASGCTSTTRSAQPT